MSAKPDVHYLERELYERVRTDASVFDFIQSGSLDGIWYWDLEKQDQEWMSARFWETLGYDPSEMDHSPSARQGIINADDLELCVGTFERHCADPDHPYDQVVRYRHRDGHTVWIRCRGIAIRDDNGKPIRMLGAHTDVTDLVAARVALHKKSDMLQRANAELDNFAYILSHDLKEPLRAISSYAQLLRRELGDEVTDRQTQLLDVVDKATATMRDRITALLELSRVGRKESSIESVSIETLINDVLDVLAHAIGASGAVIDVQGPFPTITCDTGYARKILQHLIQNAIQYNDGEDKLVVVGVEAATDPSAPPTIYVRDNGIGIPPRHHDDVFKVFRRLHGRDAYGGGTGMGLTLAQRMVEHLEGRMRIKSTGGGGTTVLFTLGPSRTQSA